MSENSKALLVVATDDIDTLMRVLSPFAVAGVRSIRMAITPLARGKSRIRIIAPGLSDGPADLIAKRLANISTVERVRFSALPQPDKMESKHA